MAENQFKDNEACSEKDNDSDKQETAVNLSSSCQLATSPSEQASGQTSDIDPFAYLKRDEFTSEIFKIEMNNLPKKCGIGQLRKKLVALGLKPRKVKVLQSGLYGFANFKCEEERQKALEVLDGLQWKGKQMKVKKANPSADPFLKKRKQEADGGPDSKISKTDSEDENLSLSERLNQAVSPLWKVPYDKQLEEKTSQTHSFIKRLGRDIEKNIFDQSLKDWFRSQFKNCKGLCCDLLPIKPSPVLNSYRNKCEFTIGQSPDGQDKTVGFRLGSYKGGSISVVEPEDCLIIPESMKHCVKTLQHFLQTLSDKPGFDPQTRAGNWKMVLVRTNQRNDIMMVVYFHPQKLPEEVIAAEKQKLREYFTTGLGREAGIKALYFQIQSDRHEQDEEIFCEHLEGDKFIMEDLLEMKFRISPQSFFQVNARAAEILYSTVGDWCNITSDTVLLDICCGTGTIGLSLAKRLKNVVGIELCKEAVDDAKINAENNGIQNVKFYCGKAETLLPSIIGQFDRNDVVAVVDPPRAGLHQDVIKAIRKCTGVKRLVYVSCKPTGALANLLDLTRSESRRVKGPPFRLIQAIPVDLFPHTPHFELVMLLEREDETIMASPERTAEETIINELL
ncbi:hypothetical protein LSH36_641g00053 [Paralvinella palmiformis]|uniref:tRNA (uracil(54)-C(5))-methyltransferase n=1 Tax=Paralvinella palmiformis TaxID=53620 RepID=A0AAD9J3K5_9ANNE|nr:hypothetical protein LSH36_641g00053 [Paralvinella palmiformis]